MERQDRRRQPEDVTGNDGHQTERQPAPAEDIHGQREAPQSGQEVSSESDIHDYVEGLLRYHPRRDHFAAE